MSFLDTTLTPESGYTYVNYRQVYDTIASQLTAHSAWTYVESVDYVTGSDTRRTFVWKNLSTSSGLPKDFYVLFTLQFTTSGEVYQTVYGLMLQISISEDYDSGTKKVSKVAPQQNPSSFTLNADQTHPVEWTLTAARPTSGASFVAYAAIGPTSNSTSHRMLIGVTDDVIYLASNGSATLQVYVGAIETVLSETDDPMPIGVGSNYTSYTSFSTSSSYYHMMSFTRHPLLTPGTMNYAFGFSFYHYHTTGSSTFGGGPLYWASSSSGAGVIGDPTNPYWSKFLGGVIASKACVTSSGSATNGSTRGGVRGFLKNILAGQFASHSFGDTFSIEGKSYVGIGNAANGVWDTTA